MHIFMITIECTCTTCEALYTLEHVMNNDCAFNFRLIGSLNVLGSNTVPIPYPSPQPAVSQTVKTKFNHNSIFTMKKCKMCLIKT